MSDKCRQLILERIRERGPLTFAQFMEIALYDPQVGYYSRATRRSGQTGDFYTSVDVSPLFGEMLAEQIADMARLVMARRPAHVHPAHAGPELQFGARSTFDLVEAGAGNGRLSHDVLDALARLAPDVYDAVRLHLVERSPAARSAHVATLGPHADRLASSGTDLPSPIRGVVFANELLDALPTHVVVARADGLREIVIDAKGDGFVEREAAPSTPAIEDYLRRLQVRLPPGFRTEVNLGAVQWVRNAARALDRGFLLLLDYGHEATTLYSASHSGGTLATFTAHVVENREAGRAPWFRNPGDSDITAHVDFTSVRRAAESEGLECRCLVDQMHFLLGLGVEDRLRAMSGSDRDQIVRRLALKALLVPGGLGTTHHVMIFSKKMAPVSLRGCAFARSPKWSRGMRGDRISPIDPRD